MSTKLVIVRETKGEQCLSKAGGRGNGELLFNGDGVTVVQDGKISVARRW